MTAVRQSEGKDISYDERSEGESDLATEDASGTSEDRDSDSGNAMEMLDEEDISLHRSCGGFSNPRS
ncbi:unnamed protein product [Rotaria sp. Silwood2]|nr:unnamed protein product [Rotaria sp. Silwood2]CAF4583138.1 unnamed protein product [Rotaria sp. Silwood2]